MFLHKFGKKLAIVLVLGLLLMGTRILFAWDFENRGDIPSDPILGETLEAILYQSNQYTQTDDLTPVANYLDIPASFALVGETDELMLYAEPGNGAIRVVNKADGFIYGSSFAAAGENLPNFNTTWEGIVNSCAVLKYYSYNDGTGAYTVVEESMFKSPETVLSYSTIPDGFEIAILYGESGIGLTVRVYLAEGYLHVEIPADSVTEGDTFKLRSVKLYPFLGSVYGDSIPGYIFVPDGSGALIRYKPIDEVTDIYEFVYYGTDPGIYRTTASEAMLNFPVSGMVQGIDQHGFVQIIEDGDAFATFTVSPAKNNLKYYYSFNEFTYRNIYTAPTSKAAASAGSGQQVIQTDRNSCQVRLVYRFLSGSSANYVGMANAYQDYLREKAVLSDLERDTGVTPALIELIGAETKQGFLFDELQVLTSYAAAATILTDLSASLPSMSIVYKGWSKGGYTAGGVRYASFEPRLGTAAGLKALIAQFDAGSHSLDLYADYVKVYENGKFNLYRDVSQRIDASMLSFAGRQKMIYFLNPLRMGVLLLEGVAALRAEGMGDLALGSIGYTLYSDYKDKTAPLDRAQTIAVFQNALAETGMTFAIYRANAYLLAYADKYLLVPTASSNFNIYTDTVPFVAILLSGTMETYGPYANFFANLREEELRSIDYGLAPSFILTEASAFLLQDTELSALYSSSYATWETALKEGYAFIAGALDAVYGSRITGRNVLAAGVVKTTYANGISIYVNYTNADVPADGHVITAQNYGVVTP